jgi:HD-GYP domain-containing protein (c-di-GMP phosphodiesterase class II)
VTLAWPGLWKDPARLEPALAHAGQPGHDLVLMGTEEDFADEVINGVLEGAVVPLLATLPIRASRMAALLRALPVSVSRDVGELQLQLERAKYENNLLIDIGRALSQKRDLEELLGLILLRAREVTGADAGSVYLVEGEEDERMLRFTESQNDSLEMESEGFVMPVSQESIVGTCVLAGEVINIPDLYSLDAPGQGNNPWGFVHDRSFDEKHGYQTRSMVTIPMISARDQVMGVIQLINKRGPGVTSFRTKEDFEAHAVPFDEVSIKYATTLASQAGIALETSLLYDEVKTLFEGFVHASVTAIESRDPTTSGHSERVADLTVGLAKVADRADSGPYADLCFTGDEIKQIEYAALLHDFGKVGVREHVLVKPKKLYEHERELIEARFQFIRRSIEVEQLRGKVGYLMEATRESVAAQLVNIDQDAETKLKEVDDFLNFVLKANEPTVLEQGGFERIAEIAARTYLGLDGQMHRYLTDDEAIALQIARGSLTVEERQEIESHVVHTFNFLRQIPWGRTYKTIPEVAGAHHEKLDGSGYPRGLKEYEIPAPAKMMTISDIFDALTASDRPYKRAVPLTKALDILQSEVDRGKLDASLFEMFLQAKVFEVVVAK